MVSGAEARLADGECQVSAWRLSHWVTLSGLAAVYAIYAIAQWSLAYIDFGDGNYLYIGRRIAEGAVVYRDILAPQPPCHLYLGAVIWQAAGALGLEEPIYLFRSISLLLRLIGFGFVVKIARRVWGRPWVAVLAGGIYLWLPIGYWWSLGWQSEPLETVFLLAMVAAGLRGTKIGDIACGLYAALATLTNATAWPFLGVALLVFLFRAPRRLPRIMIPWAVAVTLVTVVLQIRTGGAFLDNVVFNQVGTYPPTWEERFAYGMGKILDQGGNVILLEGFFVFMALLGLVRMLKSSALPAEERSALGWYLLATIGSIVYVTKGGTEDYIFSLADPAVAILAAGEIEAWARRWRSDGPITDVGLKVVGAATLALFALLPGGRFHAALWQTRPFELSEARTDKLVHVIRRKSTAEQPILAPPFYAVRAQRRLWEDYSELFIWIMKYKNDRRAEPPNPQGEGWSKIQRMAGAIERRELGIVVLEMDQTGVSDEVMLALQRQYVPLAGVWQGETERFLFMTRNTRLGIFVPAAEGETAEQAKAREAVWNRFKDELGRMYGPEGIQTRFALWYDRNPNGEAP
jgi:hypothetical protein